MAGLYAFDGQGLRLQAGQRLAHPVVQLDMLLRGVGQVVFQNNAYSGALLLLGLALHDVRFAAVAALGAFLSNVLAALWGVAAGPLRQGVYGFNGVLVGIALLYFLQASVLSAAVLLLALAVALLLQQALERAFAGRCPTLTAPFVLASLLVFLAAPLFARMQVGAELPRAGLPQVGQAVEGVVTWASLGLGTVQGLGQIFFQGSVLSGAVFFLALFISSRHAALAALCGSFVGAVVAWLMGVDEPSIRAGGFGFNSALVALALWAVFLPRTAGHALYAAFGAVLAAFAHAALSSALAPLGAPAMTAAFVLCTWLLLWAAPKRAAGLTAV